MENEEILCCPLCKADTGFYLRIISRYNQHCDWDGEPIDATEQVIVKGGKRKYCSECNKDITNYVNQNVPKVRGL